MIVFGYGSVISHAQHKVAWSLQDLLPELTALVSFSEPVEKIEQVLEEERNSNSALKAWIYAVGIETSLNPGTSGQWDTIPGKGYVWRIGIHAGHALSLNLFIENYRMQPGMALYVYGRSMDNIAGPFDVRNNANGGVLPVQSLPGDRLVVEWNIPMQAFPRNDFTITSVGYGFRDIAANGKMVQLAATDCNIDINCRTGNHWQREQRSVVRMETIMRPGTQYCTGTLVNQAVDADRKEPYILTANHCISTNEMAQNTTFIFGYENPHCEGNRPSLPAGITGSTLLATKRELDFTLVKLNEDIQSVHRPYYAGWSSSTTAPQSVTGIHHPQGDVKKIAVGNKPLITGTFEDDQTDLHCDKNAHWIVRRWDEGVTEPGSSGSPIFNKDHRIVGTLSGGVATCKNPVNDYYSKFSAQWNKYPDKKTSLKTWLDPENRGVSTLWGYDPASSYEGRCDTLGHIGDNESRTLIKSGEWGYLTGQNDQHWISFAEKIRNDTIAHIIGMEVHVAKVSGAGEKVQFAVWRGPDFPIAPLYMKDIVVTADYINYPMHIYFDKTLEIKGDYFIGYSLEYSNPPDNTFAVYQSAKRPYAGLSAMYVEESNGLWRALDEYLPPINSSLGVRAIGRFNIRTPSYLTTQHELKILFRHGSNTLLVCSDKFETAPASLKIECYDTSGKRVLLLNEPQWRIGMIGDVAFLQVELDVSNLPPGIYLLQVINKNKKQSGRFIRTF